MTIQFMAHLWDTVILAFILYNFCSALSEAENLNIFIEKES